MRASSDLRSDGVSASEASGGSSGLRPDGGQFNRREVAYRLFAAEFEDADLEYSDSDEERAPNYVVTPTGARVNRLFVVGVLTEVEPVSDDVLRARIVDPTGAFVVYAGQYQPEAVAFLEGAEVPSFVAVTGKARTFRPEGGDRVFTSVRPETMTAVDAETRDRWTVQAAEHTLARVATAAAALDREERGEALAAALRDAGVEPGLAAGVALAIDHYGTTTGYLAAVRELSLAAAEVVAGEREEVPPLDVAPDEGGQVEAPLSAAPPVVGTLSGASAGVGSPEEPAAPAGGASTATAGTSSGGAPEPAGASEPSGSGPGTPEPAPESTASDPGATEPAATDDGTSDRTDDLGDFEDFGEESGEAATGAGGERYELDEAEREQVEAEFDTEFSTAGEVGEPGEAGIEPEAEQPGGPDAADEPAADGADDASEVEEGPVEESGVKEGATDEEGAADDEGAVDEDAVIDEEAAAEEETADAAAATGTDGSGEPPGDVDLEDAVVETMADLDDGDGADREAVVAAVVEAYGVEVDVVEAAIRDALMDGRCYEPADGTLKAV